MSLLGLRVRSNVSCSLLARRGAVCGHQYGLVLVEWDDGPLEAFAASELDRASGLIAVDQEQLSFADVLAAVPLPCMGGVSGDHEPICVVGTGASVRVAACDRCSGGAASAVA